MCCGDATLKSITIPNVCVCACVCVNMCVGLHYSRISHFCIATLLCVGLNPNLFKEQKQNLYLFWSERNHSTYSRNWYCSLFLTHFLFLSRLFILFLIWFDLIWLIWFDLIWFDLIWFDLIDLIWLIWFDLIDSSIHSFLFHELQGEQNQSWIISWTKKLFLRFWIS
jgi:hypothetical protein